jgi:glycosyltransferase involved in cell wall biosynthesis
MRIAHVTDCYLPRLGGIEMHVHDLANRQRAAGHDVHVITLTPEHLTDDRETSPLLDEQVPVTRVKSEVPIPPLRSLVSAIAVRSHFAPGDFDVVHAHTSLVSPMTIAAARSASRVGIPTVITIHSLLNGLGPIPRLVASAISAPDWPVLWSGVSEAAAAPLRRSLGRGRRIAILANGIDPEHWRTAPAPRESGVIVIATVMRLERRKRPMPLLHMLRRLRENLPTSVGVRVEIIGEGSMRSLMERYLVRHDMAHWVRLPGRLERDEIREVYEHADMYVAPATLESFGIAALEARCAGIPVVGFRRGGVGELIAHGQEGLLASDDRQMVGALRRLCVDVALRERITAYNHGNLPSVSWASVLRTAEAAYIEASALVGSPPALSTGQPV